MGKFFAVVDAIAIAIRLAWVGAGKAFFGIAKSIVVRVVCRVGYDAQGRASATFGGFLSVKRIGQRDVLYAVTKAIGITIGFVRISAMGKFFAIVDTIAIAVRFAWVRSSKAFFSIAKSIVVRVVGRVGYDALGRASATFGGFLSVKRIGLRDVLFAVTKAIGITIGFVRIGAVGKFLAV